MAYFEQRKSGWSVKFRITEDGVEKQKRLSGFATKREAVKAYNEYIQLHEDKKVDAKNDVQFSAIYHEYMRYAKDAMKESSYINIKCNSDKNIYPYFEKMKISDISPLVVTNWVNSLNLKFNSRKINLQHLKMIFTWAERVLDIHNPISKIAPIKDTTGTPKKEMQIWSPDEFNQFISVVDNPIYHAMFRFLYLSGCRRGEAFAIQWSDINGNIVHISKQISFITEDEKGWKITSPKSSTSDRYISLPDSMIQELHSLQNNGEFVFSKDGKTPVHTRTVDINFDRYMKISGVKKIRIHDLRHSCASFLISQGLPITAVSKRLGHSSVAITLQVYSHMLDSDEKKLLDALNKI